MNEPKLRFPEFSGEWEEKTLGEECEITAGGDIPKEKISKEKTEIYKVPIISNGIGNNAIYGYTDSPKITQAAITISARGTIGYAEYREYPYYPIVRLLSVFPKDSTSLNTKYLSYILSIQKYDVTNAGIPQLTVPMIGSVIFHIPPSPAEQRKIASCLSAMDDLIAAQAEKVEALKEKKTGMMQQLFPQPGETTPRLRFPEFTGEWEYTFGNELFEPITNKNHNSDLPILALTQDQGAVPREMISYNVIVSEKSVAGYKVVEVDDFIISLRSFQGGIEYSRYKGLCSPAYIVLRKKDKNTNSDFYRIYFKSFNYIQALNKNLEGIRDGKMISYSQFSEIKLPSPSPAEQEKIAFCLSALDDQIAVETEKLTALKDYKKGLMQQLFPQPAK